MYKHLFTKTAFNFSARSTHFANYSSQAKIMFNFIWRKEVGIKEYTMTVCSMNYSIVTIIIKG